MDEHTKIYIEPTELPNSCAECLLLYDYSDCIITGDNIWDEQRKDQVFHKDAVFNEEEDRLPSCPLRTITFIRKEQT